MIKAEWTNKDALDLQPTCNQLATDTISRQAAIDELKRISFSYWFECGEYLSEDTREIEIINSNKALEVIEALPSAQTDLSGYSDRLWKAAYERGKRDAQPDIIRCKDCKHKPSGSGANHDISFPDEVCPCQCEDYWYSWMPKDDWFCGSGERREE